MVYFLGAGANQSVSSRFGPNIKPPLDNNFFQLALNDERFGKDPYISNLQDLFQYILTFWKITSEDLKSHPLSLEELFSFLELQRNELDEYGNRDEFTRLTKIEYSLKAYLAEYLTAFEHTSLSGPFLHLSELIFNTKPTTITLNYDSILEMAIESASRVNITHPDGLTFGNVDNIPFDELAYSHFNWNRPLCYGIKFHEIELQRAGPRTFVNGERFYSHPNNQLYDSRLLKLHGSLNWFRYLPIQKYKLPKEYTFEMSEKKLGEVIFVRADWRYGQFPELYSWYIEPIIITPVLYKEKYLHEPVFSSLWKQAFDALSSCQQLVIIGYSFPPTDFHVKRLFLEAFSNHSLEELTIINPDTSTIGTAKYLTHFHKPVVVCKNLEEYISYVEK